MAASAAIGSTAASALSSRRFAIMGALIFVTSFVILMAVAGLAGWTADSRTYAR